jgi:ribosomal protein L44E
MDRKRSFLRGNGGTRRTRRKLLAVQKVFRGSRYRLKCEKCGMQITEDSRGNNGGRSSREPYRFCEGCSEEYTDYIERLKGGGDTECYWRNAEWLESWRRWIDYQGALDRFVRSKEFAKLLQELQDTTP